MGPTETIDSPAIAALAEGDVEDCLALSTEAGWNQNEHDWRMMLRAGHGFGIRVDGRTIASSLALPYPPYFGWISMVIVHQPFCRRGFATRLLNKVISHLQGLGLTPMLDATPAGKPIYLPRGFRDVEPISRWRSPGNGKGASESASAIDLTSIRHADLAAFGADRSAILTNLAGRPGAFAIAGADGAFLLSRAGRTATQIGPAVARSDREAMSLVDRAIGAIAGPLLIDVPDRGTALARLLAERGFVIERQFSRMALGRDTGFGEAGSRRVIAGPELG